jgi:hypothetical protein
MQLYDRVTFPKNTPHNRDYVDCSAFPGNGIVGKIKGCSPSSRAESVEAAPEKREGRGAPPSARGEPPASVGVDPTLVLPAAKSITREPIPSSCRDQTSLTIRTADGSTLLETRVEHMHQAFQTLIDWSMNETGQDLCAAISGPNGFYTNHRIKASRDFRWIESEDAISEMSV